MCWRDFQNTLVKKRLVEMINTLRENGKIKNIIAGYLGKFE